MSLGEFPCANHGTRFLGAAALTQQPHTPFVIAGVPFDGAVTNRPGARFGPEAIRRASLMLCDGIHPVFNVSPLTYLADAGDMRLPNASPLTDVRTHIEQHARTLMAQHHAVFLGGDHSVTLALLKAAHARFGNGEPLAVVHFDAHCDTWTDHFGEPSGHGTWVYEAIEEGLVDPQAFVQIGIRSAGQREARDFVQQRGGIIQRRGARGEHADRPEPGDGGLRAAAAVVAARTEPDHRRRQVRSVWAVLPTVAPELAEWSEFFALSAKKRSAAEAGVKCVSTREANDLLRDADAFLVRIV